MAERKKTKYEQELADKGMTVDDVTDGEPGLEYIDTENNPGELTIALPNIRRVMEHLGWSYERAARKFGIPGHPHFKDIWPVTRYWGDARWARERLGLPLEENEES